MKTISAFCFLLSALAFSASADDLQTGIRDKYASLHLPDPAFARAAWPKLNRASLVPVDPNNPIALPRAALVEEVVEPEVLTLEWTPGQTVSNGVPTGFILWRDSPSGLVQVLTTNSVRVDVPAVAGTYYVTATNLFGYSKLSMGLVYPKPITNILTFGSSIPEWSRSWTNQATAADRQFYRVKYEVFPSGTNKASVVYASSPNAPANTNNWQPFTLFPVVLTTNRNIQLFWRLTVL